MSKAERLCAFDRYMIEQLSERTLDGLNSHKLFKVLLPSFRSFLELNVRKEVQKDAIVIRRAAAAQDQGEPPDPGIVEDLLAEARKVDDEFSQQIASFPIHLDIQYGDIDTTRETRFRLLLEESYLLLARWNHFTGFRDAVRDLYSHAEFEALICYILQLYTVETRKLNHSIKTSLPLKFAKETVANTIDSIMGEEADRLGKELARRVYG